jgi:hypothetical protein
MNTIVMNTLNGAVTEHVLALHSITADFGGSDDGLFQHGGDLDAAAQIVAGFSTASTLWGAASMTSLDSAYFSMIGEGQGDFIVKHPAGQWTYRFPVRPGGESRAPAGKGIKDNYLAFAYQNVDGADFRIDRVEIRTVKSNRRI